MPAPEFTFVRQGRSLRAALALLGVWALILLGLLVFEAALWILGLIAVLSLPAMWDFAQNPTAGLRLSDDELRWHTGRREAALALSEVDHMRFDTRLDFSVRVSAVLDTPSKKRVRLPYESLPPHRVLESELTRRGVIVKRHHFRVL